MNRQVIKVFGVEECVAAFNDLPRDTQNRTMRIAINAAGGVIRDAAVAAIPRETGLLRKSIKVKVRVPNASYNPAHWGRPAYAIIGPARGVVGVATTVRGKTRGGIKREVKASFGRGYAQIRRPSRYAHLLERGAKPHAIKAKTARVLSNDSTVFGKLVNHPGTQGIRFLSRAASNYGPIALAKMARKLREGVGAWAAKRAARVAAKNFTQSQEA